MNEKRCLESFVSDIDKIITGQPVTPATNKDCDQEYQELLVVAQLLATADYTEECQRAKSKVAKIIHRSDELEDDDLDMVAGGANPNSLPEEQLKKNKKG